MRSTLAIGSALCLMLLTSCDASSPTTSPSGDPEDEILVFAAASLTDAFGAIESAFERSHPGIEVRLNLAGTPALREQILEGAPADVYAAADMVSMGRLEAAGEVDGSTVFARNLLQIAVPRGNPGRVEGLEDFGRPELLIGLCAVGVPCGDFAREALDRAGVTAVIDTAEPDVRALLTKIEVGELDAGMTYVTDVLSAGESVEGLDIPEAWNEALGYPIAVLSDAPHPGAAVSFVEFVLSDQGQAILAEYGFASP